MADEKPYTAYTVNPFDVVEPTEEQAEKVAMLREDFKIMLDSIEEYAPSNAYRTLAIRALTEAGMWATKSITHG